MDKAEMLALMVTAKTRVEPGSWEVLLTQYAERLERIAPKLTEEAELFPLLAIGATIYQRWCQHSDSEAEMSEALLRLTGRA